VRPSSAARPYLVSALAIVIALAVRALMAPLWETTAPFALFMFATALTAWFAGTGPALVTGAAGVFTRVYFDAAGAVTARGWEEGVRLALFVLYAVAVAIVLNRMREDRRALSASVESARRELEERRRVEAALRASEQRLQQLADVLDERRLVAEDANRLKDEFLAVVSHELRTPLNAILGWSSLLRGGTLPPARTLHALDVIARNARRQSEIVGDLIDAARTITGQLRLERLRVTLQEPVYSAIRSVRPAADARFIELVITAPSLPLLVWGDANRLEQVVGNVLANAVKFTPPNGRVEVRLAACDGFAEITIADTGIGIDPDTLPFVFDRFHQGDSSPSRSHGGLGLGLTIARHIVELHRGSLEARSEGQNKGATFTIRLPLLDVSAESEQRLTAPAPVTRDRTADSRNAGVSPRTAK
jgi:signal transduction histidine kinase